MHSPRHLTHFLFLGLSLVLLGRFETAFAAEGKKVSAASTWVRHTIDDSSRGADGVRPLDINGDGLLDLVTGWEEGGRIRAYLHPGTDHVKDKWPAVTVGAVKSPEDAVFADLDGDGNIDVISSCEGKTRSVYVHWGPSRPALLDATSWQTEAFPELQSRQMFMFCLPMQIDGRGGIDLVLGSKGTDAQVSWLQSPNNPRQLVDWTWDPLYEAGWIMSLFSTDMDHDGDLDILLTDRKGNSRGCKWLENPGDVPAASGAKWRTHLVGGASTEVMFAIQGDLDQDGLEDILCAAKGAGVQFFRRTSLSGQEWETFEIPMPPDCGSGKGVQMDDLNGDGRMDLIVSCEHSENKHGVFGLITESSPTDGRWSFVPISGDKQGVKFDLLQLIDLDGDGDRDVLTCEERHNLGVIWYENPLR